MRLHALLPAALLLGLPARAARADDDAPPNGDSPSSLKVRLETTGRSGLDHSASLGVGLGVRLERGPYALGFSIARVEAVTPDGERVAGGAWEVGVRAYRSLGVPGLALVGGVTVDHFDDATSIDADVGLAGSIRLGRGLALESELTVGRREWLSAPEGDRSGSFQLRSVAALSYSPDAR